MVWTKAKVFPVSWHQILWIRAGNFFKKWKINIIVSKTERHEKTQRIILGNFLVLLYLFSLFLFSSWDSPACFWGLLVPNRSVLTGSVLHLHSSSQGRVVRRGCVQEMHSSGLRWPLGCYSSPSFHRLSESTSRCQAEERQNCPACFPSSLDSSAQKTGIWKMKFFSSNKPSTR